MKKIIEQLISQLNGLNNEDKKVVYEYLKAEFDAPKKRGRKGSKIRDAYIAITYEPQDFEALRAKFDVSEVVLRQHSRFDPTPERGKVKTLNVAGTRMIWRDEETKTTMRMFSQIMGKTKSELERFCDDFLIHVGDRTFVGATTLADQKKYIQDQGEHWYMVLYCDPMIEDDVSFIIDKSSDGQIWANVSKSEVRNGEAYSIEFEVKDGVASDGEWLKVEDRMFMEDGYE